MTIVFSFVSIVLLEHNCQTVFFEIAFYMTRKFIETYSRENILNNKK